MFHDDRFEFVLPFPYLCIEICFGREARHHELLLFSFSQGFHGQPMVNNMQTAPHPPGIRPRVRARRGQATDPHSIAERVCVVVLIDQLSGCKGIFKNLITIH